MATYKKSEGFCRTDGQDLEVKLAALLYLRSVKAGLTFELTTNVDGMGALDDIVLTVKDKATKEWATCFVQTKHKQNPEFVFTPDMFTNKTGACSLGKFLESYGTIKKAIEPTEGSLSEAPNPNVNLLHGKLENCVFVVFTNAKIDVSLGTVLDGVDPLSNAVRRQFEELLWTNANGKIFSFSSGSDKIIKAFGVQGMAFRDQLKLHYCQSSLSEFDELIKEELRLLRVSRTNLNSVCDTFLIAMKEWWAQLGVADVLCSNAMFRDAVSEVEVKSLCLEEMRKARLSVNFQDAALQRLALDVNKGWPLLHVESSEFSSRLSCEKLLQTLGDHLFVSIESLLARHESVLSIWKRKESKVLIVHVSEPEIEHAESYSDIGRDMFDILNTSSSGHRAVIVSHAGNSLTNTLSALLQDRCQSCRDTFEFSQISDTDWATLDSKFELQGCGVPLRKFLSQDCDQGEGALKWSFLVDVIKSEGKLSLGSALPKEIGYFIPRTLERGTMLSVRILEGARMSQSITVCYSSVEDILNVFSALDPEFKNLWETFSALSKYRLHPFAVYANVSCSPELALGGYELSNISLRSGHVDQVIALRIRPTTNATNDSCFLFIGNEVNDADVAVLSKFNDSKHFLRLEGKKLHWVKSDSGLDAVRRHVYSEENSVTVADVEERLVLLCAEPGMGKSTLMTHLAGHFQKTFLGSWVIRISLNDQTKLFFEERHVDALQFLLAATKIEVPIHKAMFELALKKWGNVIVLLDGFDEIAPKYADQCCVLMKNILNTKARKVWITSRNTMKEKLEDHLYIFSLKLRKFSEDDQRCFFHKYWEEKEATLAEPDQHRKEKIDEFITKLIQITSSATSDRERDLMGIPLQTQIMADVYENHVPGTSETTPLPGKVNLLDMLDLFVEKKLTIYVAQKLKLNGDKTDYEQLRTALRSNLDTGHMAAALVTILSSTDLGGLNKTIENESLTLCEEIKLGKEKTGIIESVVDGKPRFVHRVFAEFFVAKWLVLNFGNHAAFLQKQLFTANFRVVRNIFDRNLASGLELHTAVLNDDIESVRTLLSKKNVDVDSKDLGGRSALLLAASFGPVEVDKEVQRCREMLDLFEDADINQKDHVLKSSPLKYADMTESWIAVNKFIGHHETDAECLAHTKKQVESQKFLDYVYSHDLAALVGYYLDIKKQDRKKLRPGQLLARACQHGGPNIAKLLVERGADIVVGEKGLPPPFHLACQSGQLTVTRLIQEKSVDSLVSHDGNDRQTVTTNFINKNDSSESNALAYATNHNRIEIVEYLIGQGADLRKCTRHLAFAVQNLTRENLKVLELLLDTIPEGVERSAYVNTPEGRDGHTAVHVAAMFGSKEALKLLVGAGGELGPVGGKQRSALMAAYGSKKCHLDTVKYILKAVGDNKVCTDVYVNLRDSDGRTALHLSCSRNHALVLYLLQREADVWIPDDEGRTIWHLAASRGNMDILRTLLDEVPDAKKVEYLALGDGDGNTALHLAAVGRWDYLKPLEFFVKVGVKATQTNKAGQTPLMMAATLNSWLKVEHILKTFDEVFEGCSVSEYVSRRDASNRTALHHSASSPAGHRLEEVLQLLINAVSKPCRHGFVHAKDNDGSTAISLLSKKKNASKKAVKLLQREGRPLG